ncbi:sugar O-acetyltransferase [Butyrivibrio sp. NC3005]|uniref:sugar O-acetyltransferase n=1 Tax=Butyrivibrio sp. NC3005 TaxID=1280685 RepID=UPI0004193C1E|nr:sugar O-acetyltransferase [Butyrivibrio sp. NC3005]
MENNSEFNVYDHHDMFEDMVKAEEFCYKYNSIPMSHFDERLSLLKGFFGKCNGDFLIFSPFKCSLGYNVEIGNNVAINSYCSILDGGKVKLGDNIWIGTNCEIVSSGHSVDPEKRKNGVGYANPIVIEDNVYIGSRVTIVCGQNHGITIGKNSVIGSGSVITKDVPENVLVVGNPARIVRKLTEDDKACE